MTNPTQPRPFDERVALEELERLAERIQASRRQREQAVAEFDAFVKTFRDDQQATRLRAVEAVESKLHESPASIPPEPRVVPASLAPEPHQASAIEPREPMFPSERDAGGAEPEPDVTAPAMPSPPRSPAPAIARASSSPRPAAGVLDAPYARWILAAAGLLLAVLVMLWVRDGSPPPAQATNPAPGPSAPNTRPATAAPGTRPDTAVPPPVASSGPPRALNVQMVTLRPVWARVTVDDRKVMEREIPGGQTIPFGADRAISIRAGDAGAVRLIVDGKDLGPLGRDGHPATRTLAAAKR